MRNKCKKGQLLVELLVICGICAITLPALLTSFIAGREGRAQTTQRTQALSAMNEMKEALRNIREAGWNSFIGYETSPPTPYHPHIRSNGTWELLPDTEVIATDSGMTRQVIIKDTYRDASGNIVTSGGTNDPSTKTVQLSVSWTSPHSTSMISTLYMTRYMDNLTVGDTLTTDFNKAKTKTSVTIASTTPPAVTNDGEVKLTYSNGGGDWCNPSLAQTSYDITRTGTPNTLYALEGHLYTGTGQGNTGTSLDNISIGNVTPPTLTKLGEYTGTQTNAIYGTANYVLLATNTVGKEVMQLSINNFGSPGVQKLIGYYKAPADVNPQWGSAVYANPTNTVGYVVVNGTLVQNGVPRPYNTLYAFNLNANMNPASPVNMTSTGSSNGFEGNTTGLVANTTYLYLSKKGDNQDNSLMDIMKFNSATNITRIAEATRPTLNAFNAQGVAINSTGDRAFIVTEKNTTSGNKEVWVINTSTAALTSQSGFDQWHLPIIGSYDWSTSSNPVDPKAIAIDATLKKLMVAGVGGTENYTVLDYSGSTSCNGSPSSETNLCRCGGLNVTGGIYGISTVRETDGDVFAYLITGDTGGEVKIIQGGSGGGGSIGYPSTGTIESQTFESTTATAFNRFFLNYNLPTNTSLKLQVAVAEYPIGCDPSSLAPGVSCCDSATYQYRGPTSTTDYFTAAAGSSNLTGSVPVMASGSYTNPGRCFRYRATLGTTDSNTTPTLNDFTVNYSP